MVEEMKEGRRERGRDERGGGNEGGWEGGISVYVH